MLALSENFGDECVKRLSNFSGNLSARNVRAIRKMTLNSFIYLYNAVATRFKKLKFLKLMTLTLINAEELKQHVLEVIRSVDFSKLIMEFKMVIYATISQVLPASEAPKLHDKIIGIKKRFECTDEEMTLFTAKMDYSEMNYDSEMEDDDIKHQIFLKGNLELQIYSAGESTVEQYNSVMYESSIDFDIIKSVSSTIIITENEEETAEIAGNVFDDSLDDDQRVVPEGVYQHTIHIGNFAL